VAVVQAWCFAGAGGGISAGRRVDSAVRTATGTYTVTLSEDVTANGTSFGVIANPGTADTDTGAHADAVQVDDRTVVVRITNANTGALENHNFSCYVLDHRPGNP